VLGLELAEGALEGVKGELCKPGVDAPCHAFGARLAPFAAPPGQ
jgi:hypothetical protein